MRYLGMDVHLKAIVYCLLDCTGQTVERGEIETTVPALQKLVRRLRETDELVVGQEVGKLSYLVHDAVTETGTKILSFNAWQLRMIAASRKKTDKRDAYWIAKSLQTGMTPTPVYIPTGEVRQLRALLSRRQALVSERVRWLLRSRSFLQAAGYKPPRGHRSVMKIIEAGVNSPDGIDETLAQSLELCHRMHAAASIELARLDATLHQHAERIEIVQRLQTIPAVGERLALLLHAWIGDVSRFRSARELASYAGLVPSVHQSGTTGRNGTITRMGSPQLRSALVQSGHVLLWRCKAEESLPLKAIPLRVQTSRGRRKIAVVAAARHILRIAFYVMRDGTSYDPKRLPSPSEPQLAPAIAAAPLLETAAAPAS
ncbi:MAG: IS110 family transposase [Steroidobacteraceae bacterium]